MREQIALSWQRSASSGLEPAHSLEQSAIRDVDRRSRLLAAADPILDRMESMLDGSGYCVLLADRDARLVDLRFGTRTLRDVVFGVGAVVGRSFTEEASGTNSISTSFELRKPLAVRGSEHYMESMKGFSCYGHPLIHPITKRIEGVLDITFLESEDNPLLQPMLAHSAQDIQGRLLEETRSGEQRLFQAFQHASARRRGAPVVAIGDELLLENTSAVLEIDVLDEPARRTSTAAASQPLCVVGEPGTGKSTTLARLTAARAPRWFDAADLVTSTPAAWLASVETQVTAGADVVVKNIHLADAPVAHRLHALLKSARGWFALSSSIRDTSTAEHRQLLSLCTDTVELAPLRSRRHEIPDLVRGMLAEIGSRARFTPDAMRALIDHDWPGNIGELRDEVMSAAARRSVGDISEHDLVRPGARGASSRLTALDAAMRDAIVHELARCGGNKAATADSLGISRTTLYKRMKELGIH